MSRLVLVTGGLGFIGSNVAQKLVARGDRVRILDAKLAPYGFNENNIKEIRSRVELIIGDTRDFATVVRAIDGVDAVIDLAAQVSHTLSLQEPLLDVELNCRGPLNVLEAVRRTERGAAGGTRLIYGSTRGVAGALPPELVGRVDENCPCLPTDLNGVNKLAAEKYYLLYHRAHGLATCALRINNTYGPRGQMRNDDYGVVNWFLRRALLNEQMLIHGDGAQTRDYNYVDDVADAFLLALDRPEAVGEAFWLGSGRPGVSFRTVLEKIVALSGTTSRIESIARPQSRQAIEIGNFSVQIEKIRNKLGWTPKIDLDEGLRRTIDFYRERMPDYVP